MGQDLEPVPPVILIAPNVSERMGGEAIKALQILKYLKDRDVDVQQITHSRVRDEMDRSGLDLKIHYVEEDWGDYLLWKSKVFSYLNGPYFMLRAARLARSLLKSKPDAVVHYTSPISPVAPIFPIPGARVVVGPQNGNIHHPKAFRGRESVAERIRRLGMAPSQWFHRLFFSGKQTADVILVAGGKRSYDSLRLAGCRDEQFRETLDSGIPDSLRETPPIEHSGTNLRFVHQGRLVAYKGTDLAIRAIARSRNPITLEIIGDGPERGKLEKLANDLGVAERVHFGGWMKHEQLIIALRGFRAMVTPSLAEANGIVFQEAMMIGLPVICLDWGGPQLLVTPETGFLVAPESEEQVVTDLADRMDRLAEDPELANRMSAKSRTLAVELGFSWSDLIEKWMAVYRELAGKPRSEPAVSAR